MAEHNIKYNISITDYESGVTSCIECDKSFSIALFKSKAPIVIDGMYQPICGRCRNKRHQMYREEREMANFIVDDDEEGEGGWDDEFEEDDEEGEGGEGDWDDEFEEDWGDELVGDLGENDEPDRHGARSEDAYIPTYEDREIIMGLGGHSLNDWWTICRTWTKRDVQELISIYRM